MTTLTAIFCALFGLAFGSFLNVCIERLPKHQSVVAPRSRCPICCAPIRARDNVPLLSWLLLKGRCRSCKARISWRYSFVEAATAALFAACYLRFGATVDGVGLAVFCFLMLGLAWMDAETMLLPDAFTLPGIALGIFFAAAGGLRTGIEGAAFQGSSYSGASTRTIQSGVAAALAAGLILLIRWLYWLLRRRQGLGLGDAKLLAMIAAWLRLENTLLALFLGVVAAAVYALVLLASGKRWEAGWLSARLPLGAFLAVAAIYCVFLGEVSIKWYLGFFR